MSAYIHVNGTARIMTTLWAATQAAPSTPALTISSFNVLGVSVDGVSITINNYFDDVMTDHMGTHVPYDKQYMLQDAVIRCQLVWYDPTFLYAWLRGVNGYTNNTSPNIQNLGLEWFAGDLMIQNNLFSGVCIQALPVAGVSTGGLTAAEPCWNFPRCVLTDAAEERVGVQKTVWNLTWHALPNQYLTGSAGTMLFNSRCDGAALS